MFVRQAAAQFETWISKPAPIEVMRRVLLERLESSNK
jgi:shikimate 5-dehydrogenase